MLSSKRVENLLQFTIQELENCRYGNAGYPVFEMHAWFLFLSNNPVSDTNYTYGSLLLFPSVCHSSSPTPPPRSTNKLNFTFLVGSEFALIFEQFSVALTTQRAAKRRNDFKLSTGLKHVFFRRVQRATAKTMHCIGDLQRHKQQWLEYRGSKMDINSEGVDV